MFKLTMQIITLCDKFRHKYINNECASNCISCNTGLVGGIDWHYGYHINLYA